MLIFILWFIVSSGFSLTIQEIQDLALAHSSALSAQQLEVKALGEESLGKSRWSNPQLMGQFGTVKSGPVRGATTEISLTQPVPLSDKFSLRKEIAQVAVANQEKQAEFFKNWVSHQAILSAWKVVIAQELLNHGKQQAQRLALIKRYLEATPKVSTRQRVEFTVISNQLLQLERRQDQKAMELHTAIEDLKFWTGRPIKPTDLSIQLPDGYRNLVEPAALVVDNDLELIRARNQVKLSTLDRELAQKERRPDLFLGGGYRVENVQPVNNFHYGIVGLNIPLWDTGTYRLQAARAREMRDKKQLEEIQKQLLAKHEKQRVLVEYSLSQVRKYPLASIRASERSIDEAGAGFKSGLIDVTIFLQADTLTHEIMDQVYTSWMLYLDHLSTLQLMRGEPFHWINS